MVVERLRPVVRAWDLANGDEDFPTERLRALVALGATTAFVSLNNDGAVIDLLTTLRLIGGADLSLGRIYEGHVNAAQLVQAYGSAAQREALAHDLAAGRIYGVWNTEPAPGMRVEQVAGGHRLSGAKSFATGAGHIDKALITVRRADGGRQMVLADLSDAAARVNNSAWHVRGMRGTQSGTLDFEDMIVGDDALIGQAGDYVREPRFSAGAWRFTAVQLGAVEALVRHWRDHLVATNKANDPIQRARIAAAIVATRSAGLWVESAARLAESGSPHAIAPRARSAPRRSSRTAGSTGSRAISACTCVSRYPIRRATARRQRGSRRIAGATIRGGDTWAGALAPHGAARAKAADRAGRA